MLLSIIIPVYNVEPYIERCLSSCINQKGIEKGDYEIIVVNDGSLDRSFEIAQEILCDFKNSIFIDQENQGLSAARNNGLLMARGEYIWFIDSDDWIEEDALEKITPFLKDKLDLLQINYRLVFENGMVKDTQKFIINGIISGKIQILKSPLPAPAQFSIYRRLFLINNDLKFVNGIYHEDSEFKPRVLYNSEKVASVPNYIYNYFQRTSGSITATYKEKNAYDTIFVMNSLYNFAKGVPIQYRRVFYNLIGLNLNSILNGILRFNLSKRRKMQCEILKQKHLFFAISNSTKIKYKCEGILLRKFPSLFFKVHYILKILM